MIEMVQIIVDNTETIQVTWWRGSAPSTERVKLEQLGGTMQRGVIDMSPDEARELADALLEVADTVEARSGN